MEGQTSSRENGKKRRRVREPKHDAATGLSTANESIASEVGHVGGGKRCASSVRTSKSWEKV